MEQLLLLTSCDAPAGIGASLQTDGRTDRWTDRRDAGNSILDDIFKENSADLSGYSVMNKKVYLLKPTLIQVY